MNREIGEEFTTGNAVLKVEETDELNCIGCHYDGITKTNDCAVLNNCAGIDRLDGKNVKYIKVNT